MQPFKFPDFYMPWPARLNPNLEAARVHSKAWAYEMGILGSPLMDERRFDAHDYPLFCAYAHPDPPEEEFNLLTDWYIWAFFFDDYFVEAYKRNQDLAGAKEYLERLPMFMPIDPTYTPPVPNDPVERGLADLWSRLAFTKSVDWRLRSLDTNKKLLEAFWWEVSNLRHDRVPNAIEYIEMRRHGGGAAWSAHLCEHAAFVEIPPEIAATRPMVVLKDTFCDAVHLHNDILSYQKEIEEEGEHSNFVLVVERFLNVSLQDAVKIVNDLLSSRIHQFEHTAITELPLLLEEYQIDPVERVNVLLYVKGLMDWLAGDYEWHKITARYMKKKEEDSPSAATPLGGPSGLGTSAARLQFLYNALGLGRFKSFTHVPYQPVGQVKLPKFYMPFSSAESLNPHLNTARQHSKEWAREMGMLDFVWDDRKFDACDLALAVAFMQPNASAPELNVISCWMVWATYADDYFPAIYAHTRDMAGAKVFIARLSAFMPLDSTPMPVPTNAVERSLADLWPRISFPMSADARSQFRHGMEEMLGSWLWELANHIENRIPDPVDYLEMRRKTFGTSLIAILSRPDRGDDLPPDIYQTRTMRQLDSSAGDFECLLNDIFSYQKEIEFEGELNNGVLVIQNFLNCDLSQAIQIVNDLITDRVRQFEHIVATELPDIFDDFDLDESSREKVIGYVERLKQLMSGCLTWHVTVDRYKESELRSTLAGQLLERPRGIGTSAAHIRSLVGATNPVANNR